MKFWQNMKKYRDVDEEISHDVEKSIFHQMSCRQSKNCASKRLFLFSDSWSSIQAL